MIRAITGFLVAVVLLAVVALVNVAIWVVPDAGGEAPLERLEQGVR